MNTITLPIALAGSTGALPGQTNWMDQMLLDYGDKYNLFSPKNDSLYEQDPKAFLKWEMDRTLNGCGMVFAYLDDLPSGSMGCNTALIEYASKFGSKMLFCSKTDRYVESPESKIKYKEVMRGRAYLNEQLPHLGVQVFDTFEEMIEAWLLQSVWNDGIISLGICGQDYSWRKSVDNLAHQLGLTHFNPQLPSGVEWTPARAKEEVQMKAECPIVFINLDDTLFPTLGVASMAEVVEMSQKPKFMVVVADFSKTAELEQLANESLRASFRAARFNLQHLIEMHKGPRLIHCKTIDEGVLAMKTLLQNAIVLVSS